MCPPESWLKYNGVYFSWAADGKVTQQDGSLGGWGQKPKMIIIILMIIKTTKKMDDGGGHDDDDNHDDVHATK